MSRSPYNIFGRHLPEMVTFIYLGCKRRLHYAWYQLACPRSLHQTTSYVQPLCLSDPPLSDAAMCFNKQLVMSTTANVESRQIFQTCLQARLWPHAVQHTCVGPAGIWMAAGVHEGTSLVGCAGPCALSAPGECGRCQWQEPSRSLSR